MKMYRAAFLRWDWDICQSETTAVWAYTKEKVTTVIQKQPTTPSDEIIHKNSGRAAVACEGFM